MNSFKSDIRSQIEDIPLLIVALHVMDMILTILVSDRGGIFAYFYRIELEDMGWFETDRAVFLLSYLEW